MRSIDSLIEDITSTRDASRDNAAIATHPALKQITELYSSLLTGYIIRLQQINRMCDMQSTIVVPQNHLIDKEATVEDYDWISRSYRQD